MDGSPAVAPRDARAEAASEVKACADRVMDNIERVLVGKGAAIERVVVALLADGHVLVEDVPGVGKTTLVRALARSIGCEFRRIQFTPDLLPSDITGVSVFNPRTGGFEFRPGPLFGQIILADEINRTSPKTQSSLLESMEERQITVDGVTRPLPRPFLVLATQNPIEYEGTFPLAEAQVDRFLMRISLGYPDPRQERDVLTRLEREHPLGLIEAVVDAATVVAAQERTKEVFVHDDIKDYIVRLVERTRRHPDVQLGASPRGSLSLFRASRALAAVRGRNYVVPDDVKELARPVLAHRLLIRPEAHLQGIGPDQVLDDILRQTGVPAERPVR